MFSNDETPREVQNKGCVGVQRKPSEAGMYIRGTVNNEPVMILVDTEATVTLISKKSYDSINRHNSLELIETRQEILSASGTPLHVYGKALVQFKFGEKVIFQNVIVADMRVEAVLGLDCLTANKGVISLSDKSLILGDETHALEFSFCSPP